jgi:hypothetical protein
MEISMWRFAFGLTVTGLTLAFGHYFAWVRELKRTSAYIYGVGAIYLGIAVWLFPSPLFLLLCAFPAMGGAVVLLAYDYDERRNRIVNEEADEMVRDGQRRAA